MDYEEYVEDTNSEITETTDFEIPDDSDELSAFDTLDDISDGGEYDVEEISIESPDYHSLSRINEIIDSSNDINELKELRSSLINMDFQTANSVLLDEGREDIHEDLENSIPLDTISDETIDPDKNNDVDSYEAKSIYNRVSRLETGTDDNEEQYLNDVRQQLVKVFDLPEESPELEEIMKNEKSGWEELHSKDQGLSYDLDSKEHNALVDYDLTNEEPSDYGSENMKSPILSEEVSMPDSETINENNGSDLDIEEDESDWNNDTATVQASESDYEMGNVHFDQDPEEPPLQEPALDEYENGDALDSSKESEIEDKLEE